jgi:hypothetical protein
LRSCGNSCCTTVDTSHSSSRSRTSIGSTPHPKPGSPRLSSTWTGRPFCYW